MEVHRGHKHVARLRSLPDLFLVWGPVLDPLDIDDDGLIASSVPLQAHGKNLVVVDRDDRLLAGFRRWERLRGRAKVADGVPWAPLGVHLLLPQLHQENVDAVPDGSSSAARDAVDAGAGSAGSGAGS